MLQNFDNYNNETINNNSYVDLTAMLTQVIGYCGDLNRDNEIEPLVWQGGAPVSGPNKIPA